LSYLSWAWAWETLMEHYPQAEYQFHPETVLEDGSVMVNCEVWIPCGNEKSALSRTMWLAVMDYRNQAIPSPPATSVANTRMRCLTKCLAMFGLGHYIYAGEDLPSAKAEELFSEIRMMAKTLGEEELAQVEEAIETKRINTKNVDTVKEKLRKQLKEKSNG